MYEYSKKYSKSKFDFYYRQRDFCGSCGKRNLGFDAKFIRTPKGIKKSCTECHESYELRIKNDYLVEIYNNREIYLVNNSYSTSWNSSYGFETIENAKKLIDSKYILIGI